MRFHTGVSLAVTQVTDAMPDPGSSEGRESAPWAGQQTMKQNVAVTNACWTYAQPACISRPAAPATAGISLHRSRYGRERGRVIPLADIMNGTWPVGVRPLRRKFILLH